MKPQTGWSVFFVLECLKWSSTLTGNIFLNPSWAKNHINYLNFRETSKLSVHNFIPNVFSRFLWLIFLVLIFQLKECYQIRLLHLLPLEEIFSPAEIYGHRLSGLRGLLNKLHRNLTSFVHLNLQCLLNLVSFSSDFVFGQTIIIWNLNLSLSSSPAPHLVKDNYWT